MQAQINKQAHEEEDSKDEAENAIERCKVFLEHESQ